MQIRQQNVKLACLYLFIDALLMPCSFLLVFILYKSFLKSFSNIILQKKKEKKTLLLGSASAELDHILFVTVCQKLSG